MLKMRLHEVREIYVHPELAYEVFSSFGHGAFSITVELVECAVANAVFYPCLASVDLTKALQNYPKVDMTSLQKDHMFFCGKASWSFYKQKLPQLHLKDILTSLQSDDAILSLEDRVTLYKLQWLIYKNATD